MWGLTVRFPSVTMTQCRQAAFVPPAPVGDVRRSGARKTRESGRRGRRRINACSVRDDRVTRQSTATSCADHRTAPIRNQQPHQKESRHASHRIRGVRVRVSLRRPHRRTGDDPRSGRHAAPLPRGSGRHHRGGGPRGDPSPPPPPATSSRSSGPNGNRGRSISMHTHPGSLQSPASRRGASASPSRKARPTVIRAHGRARRRRPTLSSLGQPITYGSGDCVAFDQDAAPTVHTAWNAGDEPAVLWEAHLYRAGEPAERPSPTSRAPRPRSEGPSRRSQAGVPAMDRRARPRASEKHTGHGIRR